MHNPNLSQAVSVVDLARRMNLSAQKLQKLIDRGYLADLFVEYLPETSVA